MSSPDTPQPPIPPPSDVAMRQITCLNCSNPLHVRMPLPQLFNSLSVSIIALTHERFDRCPHCHQLYMCTIKGLSPEGALLLEWVQIQKKQDAPSLIAPTGENMKQALEMDKFKKGLVKPQ